MKRNGSEKVVVRGFSSVGRALALQARGHRFEPVNLHQTQGRAVGKRKNPSRETKVMLKRVNKKCNEYIERYMRSLKSICKIFLKIKKFRSGYE